tara:strand:- start:221 stop:370 length:150 start_codon:yes stop_codon:yes gene_type:complete
MVRKYSFYGIYPFKADAIKRAKGFDSKKRNVKIISENKGYFSIFTSKRR